MTDDQLRRLQQVAADAAGPDQEWGRIIPLRPGFDSLPDPTIDASRRLTSARLAAEGATLAATNAEADLTRAGIEEALCWYREHSGADHLDAAFAVAGRGHAAHLGQTGWADFVKAVQEVTAAADTLATACEQEAER